MTGGRQQARHVSSLAAIVAWFGVLLQLYSSLRLSGANGKTTAEGLGIYFGYFTILTNILVALVLTIPRMAPMSSAGAWFARPGVATATASAIAVVGLTDFLLLRHVWTPEGWQLVADSVLHYVTPILFLAYCWITAGARAAAVGYPGMGDLRDRLSRLHADPR